MRDRNNEMSPNRKLPMEPWLTLEDLQNFKLELLASIKELFLNQESKEAKKWLKSYEVRKLLNVSAGTLQTLRMNGTLPYTKMGGALYYEYKDIQKILDEAKVKRRNY